MADKPVDTRVIQPQQAAGFVGFQLTNSPWPDPQIIREYEAIAPGLGAKIIDAIPREQQFQQGLAGRKLTLEFVSILIGQIFGLVTALAAIGGAIWLGYIGQPIPATALSSFGIADIVSVFVLGRRKNQPTTATTTVQAMMGMAPAQPNHPTTPTE